MNSRLEQLRTCSLESPTIIDLRHFQLIRPRLTQGKGLIGRNLHIALIEEFGPWSKGRKSLAGHVFSWDSNTLSIGCIPINFLHLPGVEETIEANQGRLTIRWEEKGRGKLQGTIVHQESL